jgi:copper(I)-binding protein
MRSWGIALLLVLAQAGVAGAHSHEKGDIQVRHPWSRATAPGAKVAVGYMEIRNRGTQPDRLLAASTPLAERVEMHVTQQEAEVMRMRQVKDFEIRARERITLRPGGAHLMLVDITRPLQKGERFPVTLRFERAGELQIEVEVQDIGARKPHH